MFSPQRTGFGKECLQMRHITLIIAVLALAIAAPAIADRGGNGNGNGGGGNGGASGGNNVTAAGSCSVDGNVVTGTGLPNWELMNFMVTDSSGTTGWVLGYTDDGTYSVQVPDRDGATTYEFASETRGRDGSRYDVFASCNAS
jgi:hypothetical protein